MESLQRRFEIVGVLGKARCAVLYLAKHRKSGVQRVVKHAVLEEANYSYLMNEVQCFRLLRENPHPYLVDCITCYHSLPDIFFVYEYLPGGTLLDVLVRSRSALFDVQNIVNLSVSLETADPIQTFNVLSETSIKDIIRGIVLGANHLHRLNFCHRDLKLENICLSQEGVFKIIDFDLSCKWAINKSLTTFCGSVHYSAPELFMRLPYVGPEVDAWSTGVILFTLLFRRFPFDVFHDVAQLDLPKCSLDQNEANRIVALKAVHGVFLCDPHVRISYECHDFLHRLLTADKNKRMSIYEALDHPWLSVVSKDDKLSSQVQAQHFQEQSQNLLWCASADQDTEKRDQIRYSTSQHVQKTPSEVERQDPEKEQKEEDRTSQLKKRKETCSSLGRGEREVREKTDVAISHQIQNLWRMIKGK